MSTSEIPLFPLQHGIYPDGMLQLQIFEVRYLDLIKRCHQTQTPFGVVWLKEGHEVQIPGETPQLHPIGCMAHIRDVTTLQPALLQIKCQGGIRFELIKHEAGLYGVWMGEVNCIAMDEATAIPARYQASADLLGQWIVNAQQRGLEDQLPIFKPYQLDDCAWVSNRWAEILPIAMNEKLKLLSLTDPVERLAQVHPYLPD
ncbi:MAG: peptidase S16 [Limnohabitans sp.]|nr:peptidase S16 [Limnohabitans sp.]